jgi:hypothetical protein
MSEAAGKSGKSSDFIVIFCIELFRKYQSPHKQIYVSFSRTKSHGSLLSSHLVSAEK